MVQCEAALDGLAQQTFESLQPLLGKRLVATAGDFEIMARAARLVRGIVERQCAAQWYPVNAREQGSLTHDEAVAENAEQGTVVKIRIRRHQVVGTRGEQHGFAEDAIVEWGEAEGIRSQREFRRL